MVVRDPPALLVLGWGTGPPWAPGQARSQMQSQFAGSAEPGCTNCERTGLHMKERIMYLGATVNK